MPMVWFGIFQRGDSGPRSEFALPRSPALRSSSRSAGNEDSARDQRYTPTTSCNGTTYASARQRQVVPRRTIFLPTLIALAGAVTTAETYTLADHLPLGAAKADDTMPCSIAPCTRQITGHALSAGEMSSVHRDAARSTCTQFCALNRAYHDLSLIHI